MADLKAMVERKISQLEEEMAFYKMLNSFLEEQITSMSFKRADVLVKRTVEGREAAGVGEVSEGERPIAKVIRSRNGTPLATVTYTKEEARFVINPDIEIRRDDKPFSSFLMRKVLDAMTRSDAERVDRGEIDEEHAMRYEIVYEDDKVREIVVKNYRDDHRLREIMNSIRWTLETVTSK